MQRSDTQYGFTLVELAVVLLIIGLIVGGILRGQELITSARVNSIQTDANQVRTAVNTFRDKFVALPGDFENAEDFFEAGTNPSSNNLIDNGNGNGRFDGGGRVDAGTEEVEAWAHLGAAGFLSMIDVDEVSSGNSNLSSDQGAFSTPFGGFYSIGQGLDIQTNNANFQTVNDNIWIVAGSGGSGGGTPEANHDPIMAASVAAQFDRKIDDGNPATGNVRGDTGGGSDACRKNGSSDVGDNQYNVDDGQCALAVEF